MILRRGTSSNVKWAFSDPERLKPGKTRQTLTEEAAEQFASLAQRLLARSHDPQVVAHFINRLVFCMFAEDIGLLPNAMFSRMLEHAVKRAAEFVDLAHDLFRAMQSGGRVGFEHVEWFNGGLFDTDEVLPLDQKDTELVLKAARLGWSDIDPSVFGTLFERGLDPDKRSQLGAHYTDRDKIMMLVEPVIIRPLQAEWEVIKAQIAAQMAKAQISRGATRTRAWNTAQALHNRFLDRLTQVSVLDPACGSGNFLYLAVWSRHSSVLVRRHAPAHVAVSRAGAVADDTARHEVTTPGLDGCKVRKEQTGFRSGLLLVQCTRRPGMRHAFEEVWGVIGGRVDLGRHRREAQQVYRNGLEAGLGLRWGGLRIQPGRLILWRQDDGHAVVNLGDQAIGCGRDDGKGTPWAVLPILPHAPDPRKGKRLARLQSDPIGELALAGPPPFVKTVRQNQTTLGPESLLEVGFARHRLRPVIDDGGDVAPVGPFGPKAPGAHGDEIRVGTQDGGQFLRRRGIIARGEHARGHIGMKAGFEGCRVGGHRIAAAHIPSYQSCLYSEQMFTISGIYHIFPKEAWQLWVKRRLDTEKWCMDNGEAAFRAVQTRRSYKERAYAPAMLGACMPVRHQPIAV